MSGRSAIPGETARPKDEERGDQDDHGRAKPGDRSPDPRLVGPCRPSPRRRSRSNAPSHLPGCRACCRARTAARNRRVIRPTASRIGQPVPGDVQALEPSRCTAAIASGRRPQSTVHRRDGFDDLLVRAIRPNPEDPVEIEPWNGTGFGPRRSPAPRAAPAPIVRHSRPSMIGSRLMRRPPGRRKGRSPRRAGLRRG